MIKILRVGGAYAAKLLTPVAIYSVASLRDAALEPQMLEGLKSGRLLRLKSVRRDAHEFEDTCAVHAQEVCLSLAAPQQKLYLHKSQTASNCNFSRNIPGQDV